MAFAESGPADGPPVVLLHGLASDADTWDRAVAPLAAHGLRVIALDLLGHGFSDKPRSDYLLDVFADSLAAFLDVLEIPSATLCGHSFGGAVAIHFGIDFPKRLDRLVLVSAGGLGKEVHPVLRAATLPVAPAVLRAVTGPRMLRLYRRPALHRALRLTPDNLVNLRRAARALGSPDGQRAFFASTRGVISPAGQRTASAEFRAVTGQVPTLLIWNAGDPVIPVAHARDVEGRLAPGSRLVVFPDRSHEPHRGNAARFADEVAGFIRTS
jgi:pimeloyl-ACP methyl ester carboxylesterase